MRSVLIAASAACLAAPVAGEDPPLPVSATLAEEPETVLPAGTEIVLKMAQTVTTKGSGWNEGDSLNLTVASPVMLGRYVVIPRGAKAVSRIT